MSGEPGLLDVRNTSKRAEITRGILAAVFGIAYLGLGAWAMMIGLGDILIAHLWWTTLAALVFLVVFPIVTYGAIFMLFGAKFGFFGLLGGIVLMLIVFFARALAYVAIVYRVDPFKKARRKPGQNSVDPFYHGLIGGSPSKKTGIWSLPISVGASSSRSGGSAPARAGKFGGGGASGKY